MKVKKAFANGIQVYPEASKYVLVLSGATALTHPYEYLRQIYEKVPKYNSDGSPTLNSKGEQEYEIHATSHSWWSGWGWVDFEEATNVALGSVRLIIVSDKPIEVYDAREIASLGRGFSFPKPEQYGNGSSTRHVVASIWGGGANSTITGRVGDYPEVYAGVGYRTTGDVKMALYAEFHTQWQPPMIGSETTGTWWLHCYETEHPNNTDLIWGFYKNRYVRFGYDDEWSDGPIWSEFSDGSAGVYLNSVYERASLVSTSKVIDFGTQQTTSRTINVGVRLTGGTFVDSGGAGYSSSNTTRYWEVGRIPFDTIEYNNNPSVLDPKFSSSPPTDEAPTSIIEAWKDW